MVDENLVLFNGKILSKHQIKIDFDEVWAQFAPGFFETMKVGNGEIYFLEHHYNRLQLGAKYWNLKVPTKKILHTQLRELIEKCNIIYGRLRLQFALNSNKSGFDYVAHIVPLTKEKYNWNERGYHLEYFDQHLIAAQQVIGYKSNHRDIYLLAEKSIGQKKQTEVVLLNTYKEVTDTSRCAIFWIKNNTIHTPPISAGGVISTFCKFLFEQKREWDLKLVHKTTKLKDLENADEIFIANVIRGIQWVKSFRKQKYTNEKTFELFKKLEKWEQSF